MNRKEEALKEKVTLKKRKNIDKGKKKRNKSLIKYEEKQSDIISLAKETLNN